MDEGQGTRNRCDNCVEPWWVARWRMACWHFVMQSRQVQVV